MPSPATRRHVRLGVAAEQCRRRAMEDRWVAGAVAEAMLVAVFDGHEGSAVADWAVARAVEAARSARARGLDGVAFWYDVFGRLDPELPRSGSTATLLLVEGDALSAAWVGDSRALRVTTDGCEVLTPDHRIGRRDELRRCLEAGAVVDPPYIMDPETSYGLMVTRALGDRGLRRIGVTAEPEITTIALSERDDAFVVATDGLWDVVANAEAAAVCRDAEPQRAADRLVELVLRRDGADNVTVVVGRF